MTTTRTDLEAQNKVLSMIRDIEVATMVTLDEQGRFRGRPMRAVDTGQFDGTLWFFTDQPSPKTDEAERDPRVLLAYADPSKQHYVSLFGEAEVLRDPAKQKELWTESLRTWFPAGPDDPRAGLIKVKVEGAEYWDAPSSTLVHAWGYVKASVTGDRPHAAANDKVAFRNRA
jgi:general stress protein 26